VGDKSGGGRRGKNVGGVRRTVLHGTYDKNQTGYKKKASAKESGRLRGTRGGNPLYQRTRVQSSKGTKPQQRSTQKRLAKTGQLKEKVRGVT